MCVGRKAFSERIANAWNSQRRVCLLDDCGSGCTIASKEDFARGAGGSSAGADREFESATERVHHSDCGTGVAGGASGGAGNAAEEISWFAAWDSANAQG